MTYYLLNKPLGCVTARTDAVHPTVMQLFPPDVRDTFHPVGRLDIDTGGMLLVTDDGGFDNRIMQPGVHVEKCYRIRAFGDLDAARIAALEAGIPLYGSGHLSCPAAVEVESRGKVRDMEAMFPQKLREQWMKNPDGPVITLRMTVTEGKKHQVKLMMRAAGCRVFTLERLRMGGLSLDPTLAPGEYRPLTPAEVNLILPGYLDENGVPTMERNWRKT